MDTHMRLEAPDERTVGTAEKMESRSGWDQMDDDKKRQRLDLIIILSKCYSRPSVASLKRRADDYQERGAPSARFIAKDVTLWLVDPGAFYHALLN